jgi:hypothetical protein
MACTSHFPGEFIHSEQQPNGKNPKVLVDIDPAGWRMAGSGGFRRIPDGLVESYGGPGLFWYAHEMFEDFVLSVAWRITHPR